MERHLAVYFCVAYDVADLSVKYILLYIINRGFSGSLVNIGVLPVFVGMFECGWKIHWDDFLNRLVSVIGVSHFSFCI